MIGSILKVWIPIAFIATVLFGTIYLTVQQNYRQSANDPQIQMAYDTVNLLATEPISNFDYKSKFDMGYSLAPFLIIYDKDGNVVASQAESLGKVPQLPSGVFNYVRSNMEDRITWQVNEVTRIATVIVPVYKNKNISYFVLAGRNLREVEKRENMLTVQVGIGWATAIFGSLILIAILEFIFPQRKISK